MIFNDELFMVHILKIQQKTDFTILVESVLF